MTNPPEPTDGLSDEALDASLRKLHSALLDEPLPPALQQAAQRLEAMQQQARRSRQRLAVAAAVLLSFGVGWLAHGQLGPQADAVLAQKGGEREFVRQASYAYSVYLPEKRHPVEVVAAEQAHLVQWLSKRLGRPLKIPNLENQGFALVGGRLLPGDSGARAQFMFQDGGGQRITLYLGALEKANAQERLATQVRFETEGAVPSFYWAEQGFGYALSGQVDKTTLMALADSVYAQLNRD